MTNAPVPGGFSLSVLEKYLLRRGFAVRDRCLRDGTVLSIAAHSFLGEVVYPNPFYHYLERDRAEDTRRAAEEAAVLLDMEAGELRGAALAGYARTPAGFACRRCGGCCSMADAVHGRLTLEEVEYWREAGQERILRLVVPERRASYVLYTAWRNPRTGKHFAGCPWLHRGNGGETTCSIHAHRPLKCRSFPINREHGERGRCAGFHTVPESLSRPRGHDPAA
ncbi:YkgJ family cysteine cluster protein [Desulfohalovibrio reitneri]|uniref:YkgJ family cysteine cluster protein n=1 Tax=Desulfohalovibrio reitneri TaxID=1307759 RepID=UPI00068B1583|nr:YkgJ family cysteine cluster protein [Desulfohalovibrio reitneri]